MLEIKVCKDFRQLFAHEARSNALVLKYYLEDVKL